MYFMYRWSCYITFKMVSKNITSPLSRGMIQLLQNEADSIKERWRTLISTAVQQEKKNMKILLCTTEWNHKNFGAEVRLHYHVKHILLKTIAIDKKNNLIKGIKAKMVHMYLIKKNIWKWLLGGICKRDYIYTPGNCWFTVLIFFFSVTAEVKAFNTIYLWISGVRSNYKEKVNIMGIFDKRCLPACLRQRKQIKTWALYIKSIYNLTVALNSLTLKAQLNILSNTFQSGTLNYMRYLGDFTYHTVKN